ncbi:NarK family nitrate/nitrite MFS transporter [Flavihumibacter fluvii]|uniref:NarK family nitrate/nitrite MFS transporter n=1 Tax=Flavihumibacter fluvii TaxID=2838157 RepID=UPI001BDF51EC|nr:NarK family nitrate/nitrite MFS transporter [Flavihumibacter fluvii]ULQ52813.1 NarK family nitrate/nitrite MFS transporter [Flavihumibacter fluvii]
MLQDSFNQPLTKLKIFSLKGVQMKTFHITWLTFFVCFFAWFGVAPLMPLISEQLHLSKAQKGNIGIAAVSATIIARLIIGKLCDTWGPRKTYTTLLVLCSIPVMFIGLSNSYVSFLLFRLAIGVIGASFVLTQYHTSVMFAPNIKGTANAVAGGWGNTGGGATQIMMPLIAAGMVALGWVSKEDSWRLAMVIPGVMLLVMAFLYYRYTQDTPAGNFEDIPRDPAQKKENSFLLAAKDYRTWVLTIAYAACFGVEITVDNYAASFFHDDFKASLIMAGLLASIFGWLNVFARAMGGIVSDKVGRRFGFSGKINLLTALLILEGIGIIWFAMAGALALAIFLMFFFGLCLKMANGATYSIVPFINPKAIGSVAGIVGAGGNIGAMAIGFLFKALPYNQAFLYLGFGVLGIGMVVLAFRLMSKEETVEKVEIETIAVRA